MSLLRRTATALALGAGAGALLGLAPAFGCPDGGPWPDDLEGRSLAVVLTGPGLYRVYCGIHPAMRLDVVVAE